MTIPPVLFPASAILPTRDRPAPMARFLDSLSLQSHQPAELIVIDASATDATKVLLTQWVGRLRSSIRYYSATTAGAAAQRNQGVAYASQEYIFFTEDDVLFEPHCLERLWSAISTDPSLGGVSAMITNQRYTTPGNISRTLFRILHGRSEASYAGRCLGPALNLLPEDCDDLPDVVLMEWLNLGCTIYRGQALPEPPFQKHFKGYSMMEDMTVSLIVGRTWRLANARTARIYHDSVQSGDKTNIKAMSQMELVNRHYVMCQILGRDTTSDYLKLFILQLFGVLSPLRTRLGWQRLPKMLAGKWAGVRDIYHSLKSVNERK